MNERSLCNTYGQMVIHYFMESQFDTSSLVWRLKHLLPQFAKNLVTLLVKHHGK